jgi:hypothetical protein
MVDQILTPKPYLKSLKDFSSSPAPRFDCLEEVRKHIGEAMWDDTLRAIKEIKCAFCTKTHLKEFFAIENFGTEVLYDHVFDQGSFARELPDREKEHIRSAYEQGKAAAKEAIARNRPLETIFYDGDLVEDFKAGIEDGLSEAGRTIIGGEEL